MTYRCATCGEEHDGPPDMGADYPDPYLSVPEEERTARTSFTPDRWTQVHFREGGLRPTIELEPTDHPLAVEQRNGITLARAWEIVHHYMPN